jgi:hypothetical protein
MRTLARFLATLALTLLLSTPAWATFPLASDLAGVVVDAHQKPIAGATVIIRHLDTGRVITRTTNSKGRYQALNLRPDGRYQVTVIAPQGTVAFKTGRLDLGERMRRNAVLGADTTNPPHFMRAWQWRQSGDLVQHQSLGVTS